MPMSRLRELAEATAPERDRYVDFLRALAITAVVLGHWLALVVTYRDGRLGGRNLLTLLDWTHLATWIFQVMPLFFLVGGYASAASLRSARLGAAAWVLNRMARLLRPTTVLVVTLVAAAVAGVELDVPLAGTAVWAAAIPLWFLVAYVTVVALSPVMFALHERFGVGVVIALAVAVGLGDLLRLAFDVPIVGQSNHVLGWLAINQLGFAWRDGLLARAAVARLLAAGGGATLLALTIVGPYPVSMVGVPGAPVQNTSPPTLALLALAAAQTGVALLCAPAARRRLDSARNWTVVVAVNSVVLTLFLWHMTAAVVGAAALYPTGLLPNLTPGSGAWWLLRLPWLGVLATVLALFLIPLARIELGRSRPVGALVGREAGPLVTTGVVAVLAGLLSFPLTGPDDGAGQRIAGLATYIVGLLLLRAARARAAPTPRW